MKEKQISKSFDDDIIFASESKTPPSPDLSPWKLLIVDDEEEVHTMTKMVLSDYSYNNAKLEFIHAYSGIEAKDLVLKNPDCACVLLDVIMETNHAGLDVARYIRQEANNSTIRIILRTGQPGQAPEKKIILEYDINDYKEKTELTSQKLFTSITTAIRSFEHLRRLEDQKKEIAEKNRRLNEEIARRIVAESNLAKYNRSLEQMIEDKKQRLKEALLFLKTAEERLKISHNNRFMEDLSSKAALRLDEPARMIMENLITIENYRWNMTELIKRYETLLEIINRSTVQEREHTRSRIEDINDFRKITDMEKIFKHYPEIINASIKGINIIAKTASDLKSFIQISGNQPPKPLSVKQTIEKALAGILTRYTRSIDIQTAFNETPEIKASPEGLLKAFNAILINAFEAVGTQGIISISLDHEKDSIIVTISDTGEGISTLDIPRVFEPYFSVHKDDSQGLGLFIAKSLITDQGGTIEIESTRGEGTTVTIRLPSGGNA